MILYNPTTGDTPTMPIRYRPKTCFIMTQLQQPVPDEVIEMRQMLTRCLRTRGIAEIDANSAVTGRDLLTKIWEMIISVPLGIAIINRGMSARTLANIFYEIGLLQACGKETLVVKSKRSKVPSDFVRTEYIEYDASFETKIDRFLDSFLELADYFSTIVDQLDNNPLLAIDYLRRAYLISGDDLYRQMARSISNSSITGRAKNSVEMLLVNF